MKSERSINREWLKKSEVLASKQRYRFGSVDYNSISHSTFQFDLSSNPTFEELKEQTRKLVITMTEEVKSINEDNREFMRAVIGFRFIALSRLVEKLREKDPNSPHKFNTVSIVNEKPTPKKKIKIRFEDIKFLKG